MNRYDIINNLIQKYDYKTYLEIGVRNSDECFNLVNCEIKHSVDPGYENDKNSEIYKNDTDGGFAYSYLSKNESIEKHTEWFVYTVDGTHKKCIIDIKIKSGNIKSGNIIGKPFLPISYKLIKGYIVGPRVDLSDCDLTGADLSNMDLSNVILSNSNLTDANLSGIKSINLIGKLLCFIVCNS